MSVRCQFAEGGSLHRGIQYTVLHLKPENESPAKIPSDREFLDCVYTRENYATAPPLVLVLLIRVRMPISNHDILEYIIRYGTDVNGHGPTAKQEGLLLFEAFLSTHKLRAVVHLAAPDVMDA
jgi:hypothetical protein